MNNFKKSWDRGPLPSYGPWYGGVPASQPIVFCCCGGCHYSDDCKKVLHDQPMICFWCGGCHFSDECQGEDPIAHLRKNNSMHQGAMDRKPEWMERIEAMLEKPKSHDNFAEEIRMERIEAMLKKLINSHDNFAEEIRMERIEAMLKKLIKSHDNFAEEIRMERIEAMLKKLIKSHDNFAEEIRISIENLETKIDQLVEKKSRDEVELTPKEFDYLPVAPTKLTTPAPIVYPGIEKCAINLGIATEMIDESFKKIQAEENQGEENAIFLGETFLGSMFQELEEKTVRHSSSTLNSISHKPERKARNGGKEKQWRIFKKNDAVMPKKFNVGDKLIMTDKGV